MNKWYDSDSCNVGTVIGGQLCLIRNTARYPFEEKMDERQQEELIAAVGEAADASEYLSSLKLSCRRIDFSGRQADLLIAHLCIPPLFMREGGLPALLAWLFLWERAGRQLLIHRKHPYACLLSAGLMAVLLMATMEPFLDQNGLMIYAMLFFSYYVGDLIAAGPGEMGSKAEVSLRDG
mgnify:CR=1 FL=1